MINASSSIVATHYSVLYIPGDYDDECLVTVCNDTASIAAWLTFDDMSHAMASQSWSDLGTTYSLGRDGDDLGYVEVTFPDFETSQGFVREVNRARSAMVLQAAGE